MAFVSLILLLWLRLLFTFTFVLPPIRYLTPISLLKIDLCFKSIHYKCPANLSSTKQMNFDIFGQFADIRNVSGWFIDRLKIEVTLLLISVCVCVLNWLKKSSLLCDRFCLTIGHIIQNSAAAPWCVTFFFFVDVTNEPRLRMNISDWQNRFNGARMVQGQREILQSNRIEW